jgi:uncharacterized Zn-binding protein involved in type VI secretion
MKLVKRVDLITKEPSMTQRPVFDETAVLIPAAPNALSRKVVARYALATIGSRTDRGGEVVASRADIGDDEFRLACVGDRVRYADGSESVITSGAGHASTIGSSPVALVGSHIANGDQIVASLHSIGEIVVRAGDAPIAGLLVPGYVVPEIAD